MYPDIIFLYCTLISIFTPVFFFIFESFVLEETRDKQSYFETEQTLTNFYSFSHW